MNLLLDTHYLIWILFDSPRLTPAAVRLIQTASVVWFSEASIWEIGIKYRRGKINLDPRLAYSQAVHDRMKPLHIDLESLLLSCELPEQHNDLFDRLLYAQAQIRDLPLLTTDARIGTFGPYALIA